MYTGSGLVLAHPKNDKWVVLMGERKFEPYADLWTFPGSGKRPGQDLWDAALQGASKELFHSYPVVQCASWKSSKEWEWKALLGGDAYTSYLVVLNEIPKELKITTDPTDLANRKAYGRWPFSVYEFYQMAWFYAENPPQPLHPGVKKALKELSSMEVPNQ